MSSALTVVAARMAWSGVMPRLTSTTSSSAFRPCQMAGASLPQAILTPASMALDNDSFAFGKTSSTLARVSGGCFETSRPTTHSDPTYQVDDITHYCVTNMPGAVPITATYALTNATLPYVLQLAERGTEAALAVSAPLRLGVNVARGEIVHPAVAEALAA